MKSGGIRRLSLKPVRSLTRAEFEAIERNVFNRAEARWNAEQTRGDELRDAIEASQVIEEDDDAA